MEYFKNIVILQYKIAGNTVYQYALFIAIITCCIILLNLFRIIIFSRIKKRSEATETKIDDRLVEFFRKSVLPLMYLTVIYFSSGVLVLSSRAEKWIKYIFIIFLAFYITRAVISTVIFFVEKFWLKKGEGETGRSIAVLINTVIKIIIWSVALLILLDNMGFKISGLIAGVGVSGVAIAFAAQSILRDVFNYFTIFFDRPFEIGDFLVVDKYAGVVEHIGVKTTRLRSLGGEQIIFANTDLTGSRVQNFKSMRERRIKFTFGVTYQTPARKIKVIAEEVRKIIDEMNGTRIDRAHFKSFGDSSLDFEVVYYVLTGEYTNYMDIQQEINIKIMKLLEKMKVEFAYPTRTLYMHR